MVLLNDISMAYGEKLLFFDVNLQLDEREHYALVGANGAGKSTLLKLLTGEEEPLSGTIATPKGATIGWLKQDQFRYENTIIVDIVIQGKQALWNALLEKDQLLNAATWDDASGHRLGELEEIIAHYDGYSAHAFAEKLLTGLGISTEYHYKPLNALSGGYKLRVLLAQALFQSPDILLLDEPTNHLDIVSIHWLEKYLTNEFKGLVIFISHDIGFTNRLADHILDIDYGEIRKYSGNYEKFLMEKKLIEEQKLLERKSIENKMANLQQFIDRFSAGTRAKQAQSRVKRLEKIELPDIKKSSRIAPNFHFHTDTQSGKLVLRVKELAKEFQTKKLFNHLNFEINRGEKVAILGENGVGKSTLIKILLGIQPNDTGSYEWGHNTKFSYFSQDHHDLLNTHMTAKQWLTEQVTSASDQAIRKTLGQVLFTKDEVEKDILTISGGEAARLLLAKIMLESANVLLLDEPTNHLDIESNEALATALKEYRGTLIFVSHDRHFINKIANRILFISQNRKLINFKGSYAEFEKTMSELQ